MKNRILLFQKVVPSYRLSIFKRLYTSYNVITCHSHERKGATWKSFVSQMDFPNELISRFYYRKNDSSIIQNVLPVVLKFRPKIIIAEFSLANLTFWLLWILKFLFGYKLIIWTHGIKNHEIYTPFQSKQSKLILKIYNRTDGIITYSHERASIIRKYIRNPQKILVSQNTLDTNILLQNSKKLKHIGKTVIRKKLNYHEAFNIIYIGRLIEGKGIDRLIRIFNKISETNKNIYLHIIGSGDYKPVVERAVKDNQAIVYHGAIFDEDRIAKHLYISDILINTGYLGLSLVHALAYSTPVIAFKNATFGIYHSPEYEYIRNRYNGFFAESEDEMIDRINFLYDNPGELKKLSENAEKTVVDNCNIETMISGFEQAINYAITSKK